jgi:hypothetical protein
MPREKLWLVRVHPHGQAVEQGLSCEMRASTYADPYMPRTALFVSQWRNAATLRFVANPWRSHKSTWWSLPTTRHGRLESPSECTSLDTP